MDKPALLSVWLMPEPQAAAPLDALIARVAAEQGTPPFRAHITVVGRVAAEERDVLEEARRLATLHAPVRTELVELATEQWFTRSLYALADRTPGLDGLHEAAAAALAWTGPEYLPHLSLMYSEAPEEAKRALVERLDLELPQPLVCDRMTVMRTPALDVEAWEQVVELPLTGGR